MVCPGVDGENLAARALAAFRAAGGELPPLRVTIDKRIPVAAGLGGGSADAAAVLRAANRDRRRSTRSALSEVAPGSAATCRASSRPATRSSAGRASEVEPVELPPMALVLVPPSAGCPPPRSTPSSTACARTRTAPDPRPLRELAAQPPDELAAALENDLEPAALSLRPELAEVLDAPARDAGARRPGHRLGADRLRGLRRPPGRRGRGAHGSPARSSTEVRA